MFPKLAAAQVERIAAHGRRRATGAGELLYDVGAMPLPFIVVVTGAIELLHPSEPTETLIQALGPGQFTGEFNLLAGRRALARARVREAGEVIELGREQLLLLIQTDSELSEILMRAFILRRVALMERGLGDVVLVGSAFCAGTLRVKQFLARNAHPYAYLDLEQDADVQLPARPLPGQRRRHPGTDLPRVAGAAQSHQPADRRLPGAQRVHRRDATSATS